MSKDVWHVAAYSRHAWTADACDGEPDADGMYTLYDHYFIGYDKAHKMYEVGEKTMGIRYGIHWHLTRIPVDSDWAQQDMDDLAQQLMEKEQ